MKNLTPEIIGKAKAAASADELLAIAKENGIELTPDEAAIYYVQFHGNGAVDDDELDLVAGGCFGIFGGSSTTSTIESPAVCAFCGTRVSIKDRGSEICSKCGRRLPTHKIV